MLEMAIYYWKTELIVGALDKMENSFKVTVV